MATVFESTTSRAQTAFRNEAFTDFTKEEHKHTPRIEALEQVKSELGRTLTR